MRSLACRALMRRPLHVCIALLGVAGCGGENAASRAVPPGDWRATGSEPGNSRYSALTQVNRANVAQLAVAWTYHTGDAPAGHSEMQATPIVVDGVLYTTTPALNLVALRADSGTKLWTFDPFAGGERETHANRGVVYWSEGAERRIFFTAARRLYAIDPVRPDAPSPASAIRDRSTSVQDSIVM